jgi:hypothetical protein
MAALPVVVGFGVVEGLGTNRLVPAGTLSAAADRLAGVPLTVGDWEGHAEELDARQAAKAEISGSLMRRYVHRPTGAALSVLVVCGRTGPVAVHPPDVCYAGAGFHTVTPPARHPVALAPPAPAAEFWVGKFQKSDAATPERLRIYWAWSAAGDWSAPDNPRLAFAGAPVLYKLYVVRPVANLDEPLGTDPAADFLRAFVPELRKAIAPPPPAG